MKLYSVTWTKEVDVVLATEDDVGDVPGVVGYQEQYGEEFER